MSSYFVRVVANVMVWHSTMGHNEHLALYKVLTFCFLHLYVLGCTSLWLVHQCFSTCDHHTETARSLMSGPHQIMPQQVFTVHDCKGGLQWTWQTKGPETGRPCGFEVEPLGTAWRGASQLQWCRPTALTFFWHSGVRAWRCCQPRIQSEDSVW